MAQGTEAIKIVIRTTNNKYADFPMEMSSFLTIYDLKQNITLNHPTKPVKLFIYSSILFFLFIFIDTQRSTFDLLGKITR